MQKAGVIMRNFDYSFLDNGMLPSNLVNITSNIYSLRTAAAARKEDYAKIFTELESVAKVQSVKSSNAIEGIITSDVRIAEIVNKSSAPLNHDEAEIAGYRDALNIVHTEYENLSFAESTILQLHEVMMSVAGYEFAGQYKTDNNVIIEVDKDGKRNVRFRPTPASETKEAMEQLVLAYLDASSNANINQLLLIPCVILDFLCIHPFRDGNGRMSRLLSLLLLYKNGFDAGKYISFEEQINNGKAYYYEALKQSSAGWDANENDYFPFVQNFLLTLYMCYKELDKRFAIFHGKKVTKSARVEATVLGSLTPISKREICAIHPDVSPTTVEAVLSKMVKAGEIKRIGAGRSSRYVRNS
jgi:Fic family protein